jgi:cephalosporin hydroxylase
LINAQYQVRIINCKPEDIVEMGTKKRELAWMAQIARDVGKEICLSQSLEFGLDV